MKKEKKELTPTEKKRRKKRIRNIILVIVLVIVIVFGALACSGSKNTAAVVTTVHPVIGSVEENVSISGTVESEETKVYFAPVSGKIAEIHIEAGDVVEEGDLLIAYDMQAMEEALEQAGLQYTAANSSYNGSLAGSRDAQTRLNEANTNLPILEQQIKDSKAYIKALQEKLATVQTDTANALAAENMNLQKKLIELQKDPVANEDAITEVQMAMQTNQYVSQIAGTSEAQTDLQKKIEEEEERLAGYQEYKAEMEAQKQQAEAEILDSYQKENLDATEQMNSLSYESAKEDYDTAQMGITALFTGIVTEISAVEGMTVTEGMQLLTLANSEQIKVSFSVTKYDLAKLAVGQKAEVTINGKVYDGTITKINRMATVNASGTAAVNAEIHIENPDDNIYLGLDAKIEIHTSKVENALLIPIEALNADKNGDFVYVEENGFVVRKSIVTGISSAEYIEVKEGLSEMDYVITTSLTGGVEEGMAVYSMPDTVTE
ncbi:MAG: efflux RND transporter periplasmic adaptor subunit [Lachnospiraceae bacterium]